MHKWWARRPLSACRAVLFAQLVDDPSSHPDIFPTEALQKKERQRLFEIIQKQVQSELSPRSFRLNSSRIELTHPLILRGIELGLSYYGSPTLSDQALMPFETLKIGPGDSARSHTANEYIGVKEIEEGVEIYKKLLENLQF